MVIGDMKESMDLGQRSLPRGSDVSAESCELRGQGGEESFGSQRRGPQGEEGAAAVWLGHLRTINCVSHLGKSVSEKFPK